jgi:peptide chain release factor subunit 1
MQAIDQKRLDALRHQSDGSEPVLTVILALKPGRNAEHGHSPELMNVLRDLRAQVPEETRAAFDREADRALGFVRDEMEVGGRTLVIVASREIWETFFLPMELESRAFLDSRPRLEALDSRISAEPRTAVILIDRERARLLSLRLGAVELDENERDYVPRKGRQLGQKHQKSDAKPGSGTDRGGGDASSRLQASQEAWVDEHLERVLEVLRETAEELPFDWLVAGGEDEPMNRFTDLLDEGERKKIAGRIAMDLDESSARIAEAALSVADAARLDRDRALVREATGLALAGARGSLGWRDTLAALLEGRVHQLLIGPHSSREGVSCETGHYMATDGTTCPICGNALRHVPDLVAEARRLADNTSAETVDLHPAVSGFPEDSDGIAAILRY